MNPTSGEKYTYESIPQLSPIDPVLTVFIKSASSFVRLISELQGTREYWRKPVINMNRIQV